MVIECVAYFDFDIYRCNTSPLPNTFPISFSKEKAADKPDTLYSEGAVSSLLEIGNFMHTGVGECCSYGKIVVSV